MPEEKVKEWQMTEKEKESLKELQLKKRGIDLLMESLLKTGTELAGMESKFWSKLAARLKIEDFGSQYVADTLSGKVKLKE